jgi:YidC/Oxa1 family membrane protein insertase
MIEFFRTVFYEPIFNLLIFLYNVVPGSDLAIAIILLTIIIKLILYPLSRKSIESQKSLQELQPKIEEVKKQYGDDREKMGKEMMQLYKDHKVNPLSSCLPLLLQLPFLIAVFRVFRNGFGGKALEMVYPFISTPEAVNSVIELSSPNWYLAILAGGAQYFQNKMMMADKPQVQTPGSKDENMAAIMSKQMMYFMPLITVFIGLTLPGGVALYLLVTTILMILQQKMIFGNKKKSQEGENSESEKESESKVLEGEVSGDRAK